MITRKTKIKRIFGGLGILLLILILGYLTLRPWHLRWGATAEEASQAMPGDLDGRRWTRAVTVNAVPEEIWPWLVQWGQGRGGWYSYDWLENLFGFDIHSADRVLPEYQNPAIGDPICMARGLCTSFISVIETNRWFGWQASDENGSPVWSFTLGLSPLDLTRTRLIVRESFRMPAIFVNIIEIPDVVMELKALNTVKNRAEGVRETVFTTAFEIVAWLAALVAGSIAGVSFVNRRDWRVPLILGAASVTVLLVLTFLFPPLWLRGLLDLGLLAGLAWSIRNQSPED
jgi:hypothetical protein